VARSIRSADGCQRRSAIMRRTIDAACGGGALL
jgi:hypothetical protein